MMVSSVKNNVLQLELQHELQLINYLPATSESIGSETSFIMLINLTSTVEDIQYCSLGDRRTHIEYVLEAERATSLWALT
jgi:hypothetical protein